jgi:hypothetical protein
MGTVNDLLQDVLRLMLGIGVDFHPLVWALVTLLLLLVGPLLVTVSPRVIDPAAVLMATQPNRVAAWVGGSLAATFGVVLFLAITIVGAPAAFLVPVWVLLATLAGLFAFAQLAGDRALRAMSVAAPPPWAAAAVGLILFRLVRLVPLIGAPAFSIICWIGYAAVCALAWDRARSWHRRRMPDAQQFAGETLVEWYPEGDPDDGKPSIGTGAPVVGNVRGDEDDARRRDAD